MTKEEKETRYITPRYIIGPLGIWPFPILNTLLLIIERLRGINYGSKQKKPKIYEFVRDEKGRIIQIIEWEPNE